MWVFLYLCASLTRFPLSSMQEGSKRDETIVSALSLYDGLV